MERYTPNSCPPDASGRACWLQRGKLPLRRKRISLARIKQNIQEPWRRTRPHARRNRTSVARLARPLAPGALAVARAGRKALWGQPHLEGLSLAKAKELCQDLGSIAGV